VSKAEPLSQPTSKGQRMPSQYSAIRPAFSVYEYQPSEYSLQQEIELAEKHAGRSKCVLPPSTRAAWPPQHQQGWPPQQGTIQLSAAQVVVVQLRLSSSTLRTGLERAPDLGASQSQGRHALGLAVPVALHAVCAEHDRCDMKRERKLAVSVLGGDATAAALLASDRSPPPPPPLLSTSPT